MAITPAFFAKFRFTRNNSTKETAPDQNIVIDFTCDEALKAANWLTQAVDIPKWTEQRFVSIKDNQNMMRLVFFRFGAVCGATLAEYSLCLIKKPLRGL